MEPVLVAAARGSLQATCVVVGDRDAGRALVVDPGEDALDHVVTTLDAHGLVAEAVVLTHGHLDHLWDAPAVAAALDCPVALHPDDAWLWDDPLAGLDPVLAAHLAPALDGAWAPGDRPRPLRHGEVLTAGGVRAQVRHTPGHTPGSCALVLPGWERAGVVVAGDLLFAGSVGRTDLPGGSHARLLESVATQVLTLPDATVVIPGHGPATTVGAERRSNPFLQVSGVMDASPLE